MNRLKLINGKNSKLLNLNLFLILSLFLMTLIPFGSSGEGGSSTSNIERTATSNNIKKKNKRKGYWEGKHFSEKHRRNIGEGLKGNTNMLGKHLSEETKRKIGEKSKGRHPSDKIRKKMSEAQKGHPSYNLGKHWSWTEEQKDKMRGKNNPMYGGNFSEKHRKNMSKAHKGLSNSQKGKTYEEIYGEEKAKKLKLNHSKKMKGKKFTEEHRKKLGLHMLGDKNPMKNPKVAKKCSETIKKSFRDGTRESTKRLWQDKGYREKHLKALSKARNTKPNKLEKKLISLIKQNNLQYKYTGDFKFWIDGRNPDFVNCNGKKKVIELFGMYWHSPLFNPKVKWNKTYNEIIKHYKKYGFKCLVLWDYELENPQKIVERIKEFNNG